MDDFPNPLAIAREAPSHADAPEQEPDPMTNPLGAARVAPHEREVPQEGDAAPLSVGKHLQKRLDEQRTWADVAPELEKAGINPEPYRAGYQVGEARAVQQNNGVGTVEQFMRKSVPGLSTLQGIHEERAYAEALARYKAGQLQPGDALTIARTERLKQIDRQAGPIIGAIGGLPKIAGEFYAAGPILKAAGMGGAATATALGAPRLTPVAGGLASAGAATVAVPSMGLYEGAQQRAIAQGGNPSDVKNLAPAAAMTYLNAAVLGRVQGKYQGLPNAVRRTFNQGAAGVGEQALVDSAASVVDKFLPDHLQTKTKFGTIGQLARGEKGDALQSLAAQMLTFSAFAAAHGRSPAPFAEDFKAAVDSAATPTEAVRNAAASLARTAQEAQKPPEGPRTAEKPESAPEPTPAAETPPQATPGVVKEVLDAIRGQTQAAPEKGGLTVSPPSSEPQGPVRDAVRSLFGDQAEHLGNGEYAIPVGGDRFIAVTKGKTGRAELNFDFAEAKPGSTTAAAGLGLRAGTKDTLTSVRQLAQELGRRGVGIEYTTDAGKGAGGRSSRAELYERILTKAGFKKVGETTTKNGTVEAQWDAPRQSEPPTGTAPAPAISERPDYSMGRQQFIDSFKQLENRVLSAEKNESTGPMPPLPPSQMKPELWSKLRGYSDTEIADFLHLARLQEAAGLGGTIRVPYPKDSPNEGRLAQSDDPGEMWDAFKSRLGSETARQKVDRLEGDWKRVSSSLSNARAEENRLSRHILGNAADNASSLRDAKKKRIALEKELKSLQREVDSARDSAILAPERRDQSEPPTGTGRETNVVVPGAEPVPARYEAREIGDVKASHEAVPPENFRDRVKAGEYPEGLQPRDYEAPGERNKVWNGARHLEPRYLVSEHPDATSGPPTIAENGTVINGNGRQMMLEASRHTGTYEAYKAHLAAEAAKYGIDPAAVQKMENPALYRVVGLEPGSPEAKRFARAGNVAPTQAQSPTRTAAAHADLIDDGVLRSLRIEGDETFSSAVNDRTAGRDFREKLAERLPPSMRDQYFQPDGMLTEAGKEFVQSMMLSKILPVGMIEQLGAERKNLKRAVEGVIPQLMKLRIDHPAMDVTPQLQEALGIMSRHPEMKGAGDAQNVLDQLDLFHGKAAESITPGGRMILDFLLANANSPKQVRSKIVQLVTGERASGGLLDFMKPAGERFDPIENAAKLLGVKMRPGATFGAMNEVRNVEQFLKEHGADAPEVEGFIERIAAQAHDDVDAAQRQQSPADGAGASGQGESVRPGGGPAEGRGGAASGRPGFFAAGDILTGIGRLLFDPRPGVRAFTPDPDANPNNPRALPAHGQVEQIARSQLGARDSNPAAIATTTHAMETKMANDVANHWAIEHAGKPDPFPMAKDGSVTLAGGQRGYKTDVIEAELRNPGSQPLTADQRTWVDQWRGIWEKQLKAMDAAGVKWFYDDATGKRYTVAELLQQGYFPREAVTRSPVATFFSKLFGRKQSATSAPMPGVSPFFKKGRVHETEAAGVAAGTKYMPFFDQITDFIRKSNQMIADQHLADNPRLGGVDIVKPYFRGLMAENKDVLNALPKDKRDALTRQFMMLASQAATGNVHVAPAFKGKVYPEASVKQIEAMYGMRFGQTVKFADAAAQEMKNLVLGADVGYATLQLGKMMFTNPTRWIKTVAKIPEALFNRNLLSKVVNTRPEYAQAARELAQVGSGIGTMPDQIGTLTKKNSLVANIPVLGPAMERMGRAFSIVMDMAKLELWQANRPNDPAKWPQAAEALDNSLGSGRMNTLGMTPERAFIERAGLLAPSYYRAHLKLLQQAFQGGPSGAIARSQLGHLASGVLLTSIGLLYALKRAGNITDDEFEERLDPSRGKFLMVPIPLGTSGKTMEIGFGGFYQSMIRSLGDTKEYLAGRKTDNPLAHFYRGHSGIMPRIAFDALSGHDYLGNPISTPEALGRGIAPIAVQNAALDKGTPGQRTSSTIAGLVGLKAFPASEKGERFDKLRKFVESQTGKKWDALSIPEKAAYVRRFDRDVPAATPTADEAETARQKAVANDVERQKRVTKRLSEPAKAIMKELGKPLAPGFEAVLHYHGAKVPLSREQQDRYEELLAKEYDGVIRDYGPAVKDLPPLRRDAILEKRFGRAKERVQRQMLSESIGPR